MFIIKNSPFYEARFEEIVPDIALYGEDINGCRGFGEMGIHMHRHIEIQYIIEGTAEFSIDNEDYLLKDTFVFIFPYQIHSSKYNTDCWHISAIVNPAAFESYTKQLTDFRPQSAAVPISELPPFFDGLVRYARNLYFDQNHPNREQLLHDAMSLIIGETLSAMTLVPRAEDLGNQSIPAIGRVINYCITHISDDLSLSSVSKALYLNKYYISKLFTTKLGITFAEFINNQRIFCACEKLAAGTEPITEIAYECGFRNQSNFNRAFRERTGMTPREYRNSHREIK